MEESKVSPLTSIHHLTIRDLAVPTWKMGTRLSGREFLGVNNFDSGCHFPEVKASGEKVRWGMSSLRKTVLVISCIPRKGPDSTNQSATGSPGAALVTGLWLLSVPPCDSWSGRPSSHPSRGQAWPKGHPMRPEVAILLRYMRTCAHRFRAQHFAASFGFIFTGTLGGSLIFPFYRQGK